jgi:hypothetical protein
VTTVPRAQLVFLMLTTATDDDLKRCGDGVVAILRAGLYSVRHLHSFSGLE